MEHSPWEANSRSVKKVLALYGTRRCITVFTRSRTRPRPYVTFRNKLLCYDELLAPRPAPELEDNPFSVVSDIRGHPTVQSNDSLKKLLIMPATLRLGSGSGSTADSMFMGVCSRRRSEDQPGHHEAWTMAIWGLRRGRLWCWLWG
jgi:hypothetical protein